jgi:ANTAR domain-containing protein/PAS domain-containing protein
MTSTHLDEWSTALRALGGGTDLHVARFRLDLSSGRWWWSPEMFALHGLDPQEVTPTTELLLSYKHEDDRARTSARMEACLASGDPFCCRHRIIDAQGRAHTVLSLAEGTCDDGGSVTSIQGYFIDITDAIEEASEEGVREALEGPAQARAVIEQAKGILIAVYGIDAEAAYHLLRWHSQHGNVKLRLIAQALVRAFVEGDPDATSPRRRVSTFLDRVSRSGVPADA